VPKRTIDESVVGRWPAGVERIGVDDVGRFGIDDANQLFWDGQRIEIRRTLVLTRFQKAAAAVLVVCAILGGLGGILTGLNNASAFLCARNMHWLSCPNGPSSPAPRPAAPQAEQNWG
jgi:hypothetical protein